MTRHPCGAAPEIAHPTIETSPSPARDEWHREIALADPLVDALAELVRIILEEERSATHSTP